VTVGGRLDAEREGEEFRRAKSSGFSRGLQALRKPAPDPSVPLTERLTHHFLSPPVFLGCVPKKH
jgi:hypothetical protein